MKIGKNHMKRKRFDDYLKKRLTTKEIAEIKKQAQREVDILKVIQAKHSNTKETKSTFEKFIKSLSPEEREKYYEEYKELLFSELILATETKHKAIPVIFASGSDTYETENKNKHIGPDFDDILRKEGRLEDVELTAIKMVIADQVAKEKKKDKAKVRIKQQY